MKVAAGTNQMGINSAWHKLTVTEREKLQQEQANAAEMQDAQKSDADKQADMASKMGAAGGGKVSVSLPNVQVGQLATELANAQTKLDVQLVAGKAMRALANLRMAEALCEGKDKQTARQMITRMEKLMKRTYTKKRQLGKEEQLERKRKRAEKEQEQQKAENLRNELRNKRSKRRRDESNYAIKETAEDQKAAMGESPLAAAATAAATMPVDAMAAATSAGAAVADVAPVESGASLDITV